MLLRVPVLGVRSDARAWGSWLLALPLACTLGCEGPQEGTPGLDPPDEARDGGAAPHGGSGSAQTSGGSGGGGAGKDSPGSAGTDDTEFHPSADAGPDVPNAGADAEEDGGVDEDGGGPDTGPGAALFEGLWVVDQPTHALYEATQYELMA